jgi:DNA sulfur modification protein DndD
MRIDRIKLQNYRQYKDETFNFPVGKNDIHVILAKNGIGKTNLLNSITWCLYDDEPHMGNKYSGLPRYNLETAAEIKGTNQERLISVEIHVTDSIKKIVFCRTASFQDNSGKIVESQSSLKVYMREGDTELKTFTADNAKRYLDLYLPEKIREYFFFDGEQLDSYFKSEKVGQIKDAIYQISQVDIVNKVYNRLNEVAKSKRLELGKLSPDLQPIISEKEKLNDSKAVLESTIQQLQNNVKAAKNRILVLSEQLRGQDNLVVYENRRNVLRKEAINIETDLKQLKDEYIKFIRTMTINFAYYQTAKSTIQFIDSKREERKLPPDIDKGLIEKMLKVHKCFICGRDLEDEHTSKIEELLQTYAISNETSHLLTRIYSELCRLVDEVKTYPSLKENFTKRLAKALKLKKENETELQQMESEILKFSEKEQILSKYKEREELEVAVENIIKSEGIAEAELKSIKKDIEKIESSYEQALKKEIRCDKLKKSVIIAEQAALAVKELETSMMDDMRNKMEEKTTDSFLNLVWKKETYRTLKLDDDYKLDLIHKDGYSSLGSASAAERCLLALSFTLALHEVSGFNAMLFIDTPVARISDDNRTSFAEKLKEISESKQIILTFTPNEFSEEIKNIFTNSIASLQVLGTSESEKVTTIQYR